MHSPPAKLGRTQDAVLEQFFTVFGLCVVRHLEYRATVLCRTTLHGTQLIVRKLCEKENIHNGGAQNPIPPLTNCLRVYSILIYTGRGGELNQREG